MSKTPLTDKNRGTLNMHFVFYINPENGELVKAEFAEQLERELTEVTEQRDRLAEALQDYMSAFGQCLEAHGIPMTEQQTVADTNARAALAAVKGGSDE
jgi:hypothetical protein